MIAKKTVSQSEATHALNIHFTSASVHGSPRKTESAVAIATEMILHCVVLTSSPKVTRDTL